MSLIQKTFYTCNKFLNNSFFFRYYETVAIASSSTSTRKSSHYHNNQNSVRRPPYSPSIKSEPASTIYEQFNKRHNAIAKQDSNLSRQMLIKQDSNVSRQESQLNRHVFKKHYSSDSQYSNNSCQMLIKQDSSGSKSMLSNQDSFISYIEPRKSDVLQFNKSDKENDSFNNSNSNISYIENKRHCLTKQDSVISFAGKVTHIYLLWRIYFSFSILNIFSEDNPKRRQLIKQDSIISFYDSPRSCLNKQDSSSSISHISILKKTDSRGSSASPVRKTIGFFPD